MNQALGAVNEQQSRASAAAASYERGDTADIAAVMLQHQPRMSRSCDFYLAKKGAQPVCSFGKFGKASGGVFKADFNPRTDDRLLAGEIVEEGKPGGRRGGIEGESEE